MAKTNFARKMKYDELRKMVDDLPQDVRLDILQLALDLAGIVNPAADAASGFISLLRGDLLGAAISAVSIIPVGDVAKLAKFSKYRKSLEQLVGHAMKSPRLARTLDDALQQIAELLNGIGGMLGGGSSGHWFREIDLMKKSLDRFFEYVARVKLIASHGAAAVARQNGSAAGQYFIRRGDKFVTANVDEVVDLLEAGAGSTRHPAIRGDSKELLERMAMARSWRVTAGPHKKGDIGSNTEDAIRHITVKIEGDTSYHLRMDRRGHLFSATTADGPVSGINPWSSPGSPID